MLIKEITYTDYDGQEKTEELHFHLTQKDLIELNLPIKYTDTISAIEVVTRSGDSRKIVEKFDEIIGKAYGRRLDDGRFIKSKAFSEEFIQSEAYSKLFMDMFGNADLIREFMGAILPQSN